MNMKRFIRCSSNRIDKILFEGTQDECYELKRNQSNKSRDVNSCDSITASITWTLYMDYDDEYWTHTITDKFTGTRRELMDYIQDLNKNSEYYNIDVADNDDPEYLDDLYASKNVSKKSYVKSTYVISERDADLSDYYWEGRAETSNGDIVQMYFAYTGGDENQEQYECEERLIQKAFKLAESTESEVTYYSVNFVNNT